MFVRTTAINKILKLKKRKKVIQGGTSAGKTYGIIPILIDDALREPNQEISIVSESFPHLRRGALKDFLKIMKDIGRWREECYNKTLLQYTFPNGSFIEFFSADQESKVRGPRRKKLYMNECNNMSFQTYHQLAIRTSGDIYLDYNPTHEFWVQEEVIGEPDADHIILTYKDNEALDDSIVAEIEKAREKGKESSYWANWWKVYGLGEIGSLEGVVFSNWSTIDKIPEEAVLMGYGMDFGFTNDPTALIACSKYNEEIILDEVIYQTQLPNNELIALMKSKIKPSDRITAESAEPRTIHEIRRGGFNVHPVKKTQDSIRAGIGIMQDHHFRVTKNSTNLIKEFRNYCWDTDRDGKLTGKPVDNWNHGIDAVRYFALHKLKRGQGRYTIGYA